MHENAKFIIFIYQFFLLFPIFSSENLQRKLNCNNPNITANITVLYIGNNELLAVSPNSWVIPLLAYKTSTETKGDVSYKIDDIKITIKNNENENNITLVFQKNKNYGFYLTYLFSYLDHIKKVDLSHFKKRPKDISYMFYNCYNLEEVIFGNFDTSNVISMVGMFYNTKVTSLDLSRFNTTKVTDMSYMFYDCTQLEYLDLKNFDFSGITRDGEYRMLDRCKSLKYLNIYSFKDDVCFDYNFFYYWLSPKQNLIYCINEEKGHYFSEYLKNKGFINNCSYFFTNNNNITSYFEKCEDDEGGEYPIVEVSSKIIYNVNKISKFDCSSEVIFSGQCEDINKNKILSIEDKDNIITNIMNDIINGNLNNVLDDMVEGNGDDLTRVQDDITFQITTTNNQDNNEYNNISTIHLGNCETILKNIYEIPFNLSLIILKVDYSMEGFKFPVIGYEVFHPIYKIKLNLSFCDNETVSYNIPIELKEGDLDKYNTSSDYYNDECSVYTTDDGTDIIINDRNNLSLCENSCNYINYNTSSKKSVCLCEVKSKIYSISEINEDKESLSQNFNLNDSPTSSSNLNLMKCIDTLFSKYGLLKNLENYILIIMTFIYAGSSVPYFRYGSDSLRRDIKKILDNKLKNENNIKFHKAKRSKSVKTRISLKKNRLSKVSNPRKKKIL